MLRHELVEQERWITPEHFRRLLAIYQVLPGPEATELCVHFGMLARGRWGGIAAGLGFVLPGFVLMATLSWLYLNVGLANSGLAAAFIGVQAAVIALIVRACHRIGQHCLLDAALWIIAIFVACAELLNVTFWFTLGAAGLAYVLASARQRLACSGLAVAFVVGVAFLSPVISHGEPLFANTPSAARTASAPANAAASGAASPTALATQPSLASASPAVLFASGLRTGLLTFGGAYTAIPFLERDAVKNGRWMTQRDFLDGLALSGVLPAPLIIFATFVGFFAAGALGALAMTMGVFLPAFSFSLLFHRHLEAVVRHRVIRHFLEGVTAGVVGLIAVATVRLGRTALDSVPAIVIATAALIALYLWRARLAVPAVMFAAGLTGAWVFASTPGILR